MAGGWLVSKKLWSHWETDGSFAFQVVSDLVRDMKSYCSLVELKNLVYRFASIRNRWSESRGTGSAFLRGWKVPAQRAGMGEACHWDKHFAFLGCSMAMMIQILLKLDRLDLARWVCVLLFLNCLLAGQALIRECASPNLRHGAAEHLQWAIKLVCAADGSCSLRCNGFGDNVAGYS